jgi:hypothetical protein
MLAIAAMAAAVALYAARSGQASCEATDGKWVSIDATCVTRDCFASHSCGDWAHPRARSDRIKIGDSRADVYFQLGMPRETSSGSATWSAGKSSSERIFALFIGETLTSLSGPTQFQ